MSPLLQYALGAFDISVFLWVTLYRPWKVGLRREAAMRRLREQEKET